MTRPIYQAKTFARFMFGGFSHDFPNISYDIPMTGTALHEQLLSLHRDAKTRLDQLASELDALTEARRSESDDDEHDPEGVTLSSEWSRLSGLFDGAKESLAEIDAALERWDEGNYGVCISCGKPIPRGRLEARPFARECVPCAEKAGR